MNELPVIGSLSLRTDFWDHYGANIATYQKKCMANGCSDVQNNDFSERFSLFRRSFIRNGFG